MEGRGRLRIRVGKEEAFILKQEVCIFLPQLDASFHGDVQLLIHASRHHLYVCVRVYVCVTI